MSGNTVRHNAAVSVAEAATPNPAATNVSPVHKQGSYQIDHDLVSLDFRIGTGHCGNGYRREKGNDDCGLVQMLTTVKLR